MIMKTSTPTMNTRLSLSLPPQLRTPFSGFPAYVLSLISLLLLLLVSHQLLSQATYHEVLRISNTGHNILRDNSSNWTVPQGGPYRIRITARGGRGGHLWRDNTPGTQASIMVYGGKGAIVTSEFMLPSGSVLTAIPGYNGEIYTVPVGQSATHNRKGTGGGGSSGVLWQNVGHLLVAGAGGGAGGAWINASHGGVDAIQSFVADNDAGAGGNGGGGFTTQYEWDGSGGGGANSNGFNNTTVTGGISLWGGGTGGRSGLNNEGASGGGGYSGGGGASTATNGGGGGGGGFAGGDGGRHQFFLDSPDGYGGEGGKSFVSTLGFNKTISLGDHSDQAGSVVIELFARYSDFGTLIPSGIPDDLVFEYNQLQALYIATNGTSWTNNTNWLTGGDMSQWHGVTLTPDGKSILKIELPSNNLTGGNIPDLNLPQLTTLNLRGNAITGAIPNFNYLPALTDLNLAINQFSGAVPTFNNCTNLERLNLAINKLTGSVPTFPGTKLLHIDLGLNELTGSLPRLVHSELRFYSVYGNKLTGFPDYFFLPWAETDFTFNIENNNFSGAIPPFYTYFGAVLKPQNMYLRNNKFLFNDLLGQNFLSSTGTIAYAPQQKIPITFSNGILSVNTGLPVNGDQTLIWYKDGVEVGRVTNRNWFRPAEAGTYYCEAQHNTLTVSNNADRNLILISENQILTAANIPKSNAGRTFPSDLPVCLVDDFNELEKIYDATGGANWINKTNWLTSGNIASWHGIWGMSADGCDVADLVLNSNNLVGTMPALNFPSATRLSFAANQISGAFPTITAPNLKILGFGTNQLSGDIPNFSVRFALNEFYIENNRFQFADMIGKDWLSVPTLYYAPQAARTLSYSSCVLSVNVNQSVSGQTFIWLKDGVEVSRGTSNQYTPSVSGVYTVEVHNNPLTIYGNANKQLILTSNAVTVTIPPNPTVSISATKTTLNFFDETITFTATPANGGTTPQYQWYLNNNPVGTNSPTYSKNNWANGDVVRCVLTSNEPCQLITTAASNNITITVNCAASRIYIKPVATGTGTGENWANAASDLQKALTNICGITEIWVAAGTYKPTEDLLGNTNPTNAREKTFRFNNGIRLYGGFAGTETSLSERANASRSVLSGDFNNNDVISSTLSFSNNTENAYHVLSINTPSVATVINGFEIVGGNANGATGNYLGVTNGNNKGGGIFISGGGSNVTIENCVFTGNVANMGGAIANIASSPVVKNCFFDKNRSESHGGALFNNNGASPTLTNCVVNNNLAVGVGAAMYNLLNAAVTCTNTTINGNTALTVAMIYNDGSTTTLLNSIIWNSTGSVFDAFNGGSATATYSTIEGVSVMVGTGNANTNPNFTNSSDPNGADNIWGTTDDGLQLTCGSSAFNTGSNSGATTDILGNSRPLFTTTDKGAYETTNNITPQTASIAVTAGCNVSTLLASVSPVLGGETFAWSGGATPSVASNNVSINGTYTVTVTSSAGCTATASTTVTITTPASRLYVNAATTNTTKNGLSWATAFSDLQSALSACKTSGAEIWVAAGTYKPSVDASGNSSPTDARMKTFLIPSNVLIYGGFVGNETTLSQRPPSFGGAGGGSILSGDFSGNDVSSGSGSSLSLAGYEENAYHVVLANLNTQTSRLDGFTISGGFANLASAYNNYGGGVLNLDGGSNFTLANCILNKNSGEFGGGMANVGNASTQIINCVFEKNYATLHGAAVTNFLSTPAFSNCVFTGNYAHHVGGAIYNLQTANAQFKNCTFVGNASRLTEGGTIYNDGSFPTLTNTVLWSNVPSGAFGTFNSGAPTISYSIIQGGDLNNNNLNADPIFSNITDPDGADNQWFTSDDGLHLACGSPAFNSGTNTGVPAMDIRGTSRPQFTTADRGAYENTTELTKPTVTITGTTTGCPSVTLTAITTPPLGDGGLYAWSGGSTPSVATNTFSTSGNYTVTVTATNGCTATQNVAVTITAITRIYVNAANTNTTKDGTSWATAFTSLQEALSVCAVEGVEIWVAKGTYKPTHDPFGNASPSDARTKTFYLKNKIKIYGGFVGTEGALSERSTRIGGDGTILSGDLNGNDGVSGTGGTLVFTNNGENVYHVVTSVSDDATTLLDGLTIQGGNANGAGQLTVESQPIYNNSGGGLYQINASVRVNKVLFQHNAAGFGGGLYCFSASPTVTNTVFDKNTTSNHGAAAMTISAAAPIFDNCVFNGGRAYGVGGAIYNLLNSSATLKNCTLFGNAATNGGGSIYNDGSTTTLTNSIVWNSGAAGSFGSFNSGSVSATYSIAESTMSGTGNLNTNPLFLNSNDPDGTDNIWGTSDDGLKLNCGSPAFNAGTNTGISTQDITGTNRPQFSTTDIGAYENTNDISASTARTISFTGATTACVTTTLTATTTPAFSNSATYAWSGGATPSVASNTFTASGTYTVSVTDNGCIFTSSTTVTINALPTIVISGNILACSKVYLYASGGATYAWSGGTTPSVANNDFTTSGNYTVTVTTAAGCSDSRSVTVTVNSPISASKIYVNATNTNPVQDGLSWATAFSNLQSALDLCLNPNTEIWVARGTYKPTKDVFGNSSPTDARTKTFYLKNGVKIYGGFVGTEGSLSERSSAIGGAGTILSGDLNSDDVVSGTGNTLTLTNYADNAYHVVLAVAHNKANLLDGITIKSGNAVGTGQTVLELKTVYHNSGGGLYQAEASFPLNNVLFQYNLANFGGGLYCLTSSPNITNAVFDKNSAVSHGAAVVAITNSAPVFDNCVFSGGRAFGVGGAMYAFVASSPSFRHCTISGNAAVAFGGAVYSDGSTTTLLNSIIWGNIVSGSVGGAGGGVTNSSYCVIEGGNTSSGNVNTNPLFINSADPYGADNIWGTADDGFTLKCFSSAYNAGNNTGVSAKDITGANRTQYGTTDIGAYESNIDASTIPARLYVNAANTNPIKDGLSWATAYSNLYDAIDGCLQTGGEIWVAKGTYKPTHDPFGNANPSDNRDKTFLITNKLKIYGGFLGTETALSQRPPSFGGVGGGSILSGDFNGNDDGFTNNGENAYHVVLTVSDDNTTILDGFTIQGGNANGSGNLTVEGKTISRGSAGGLYVSASSPMISNCIITRNSGGFAGAMITEGVSTPQFSRSVFHTNRGAYGGVAFNGTGSTPKFTSVIFHNNTASVLGGAFYHQAASPVFNNCTFNDNTTYNEQSLLTATNCIFSNSTVTNPNGVLAITYSVITGISGTGNTSADPQFADVNDPDGADNQWLTADDGLRLACNSPARDAGINTDMPTTDALGRAMFNGIKDMGAYETQDNNGCPIFVGSQDCQFVTVNNISGNRLFNFFIGNQLVASINPNGQNLGNVTVEIGDPSGTTTDNSIVYLGRNINITSTIAPTSDYTLCLYYKDSELAEYSATAGTTTPLNNLSIAWKSGGSGCVWSAYMSSNTGLVFNTAITAVDYGVSNDGFYLQFNLNHFTLFAPTTSGSVVLTTELLAFEGQNREGGNWLFWKTAEEKNVRDFDIERSTDGRVFEKVGQVKSKGSNSIYSFYDNRNIPQLAIYRLKINDLDGKISFSKIISLENKTSQRGLKVYPNPVDYDLTVELGQNTEGGILITNSVGQIVFQQKSTPFLGAGELLKIDVSRWATGIYFIKSGEDVVKFVKN
jgi:hypothetical protein